MHIGRRINTSRHVRFRTGTQNEIKKRLAEKRGKKHAHIQQRYTAERRKKHALHQKNIPKGN